MTKPIIEKINNNLAKINKEINKTLDISEQIKKALQSHRNALNFISNIDLLEYGKRKTYNLE